MSNKDEPNSFSVYQSITNFFGHQPDLVEKADKIRRGLIEHFQCKKNSRMQSLDHYINTFVATAMKDQFAAQRENLRLRSQRHQRHPKKATAKPDDSYLLTEESDEDRPNSEERAVKRAKDLLKRRVDLGKNTKRHSPKSLLLLRNSQQTLGSSPKRLLETCQHLFHLSMQRV